ncbi:hypothetical protein ES703_117420 [subsurface metagenome]
MLLRQTQGFLFFRILDGNICQLLLKYETDYEPQGIFPQSKEDRVLTSPFIVCFFILPVAYCTVQFLGSTSSYPQKKRKIKIIGNRMVKLIFKCSERHK